MSKHKERGKSIQRLAFLSVLLFSATACHDAVENLNAPDRERATSNPSDVQAFIGGAFYPTLHNALNTSLAVNLFPYASAEFVATLAGSQDQQQYQDLVEPRTVHNNSAHISQSVGPHGPRNYWASMGRASSITYDGLQILNEGMIIRDAAGRDVTDQARAFAKFIQGWAWGYQALIFDRIHVVPESVPLPTDDPAALQALILETLVPYEEGIEAAVASLEEAIRIARANPAVVNYPSIGDSPLWFGTPTPVTNDQFIRMANTLAARLLVLSARTPEDRAQVDWSRVLQFAENGVTEDFEMQLNTIRTSNLLARVQANSTATTNGRWNYRSIGPADQSGAYQEWIAKPVGDRRRFDIVTPDRRITGPTPQSDGSYTRWRADDNGFLSERGLNYFSAYQWSRQALRYNLTGNNLGFNSGTHPLITVDENNLMKAEALLRTGNRAAAADLINITRTRAQRIGSTTYPTNLPPVTAEGVPMVNGECVPRTDSGACGDLLTALRYERMIELAGMDLMRGYTDSRGFGLLVDGALLSFPVPGNVLELYGLPEYSYGGVGEPGTATYAPATLP
jgi:hypothetical protein